MNLHPFQRRRQARRGSILIIAVGLMVFITAIFFVVSSYQTEMLQTEQAKLAAKNASLAQSSVLQALRAATYIQYMYDLNQATPSTPFSATDYASILTETGIILGGYNGTAIPITSGTPFSLPQDSGGRLTMTITSPTTPLTMSVNAAAVITNSGTWLDNTPAQALSLPFVISVTATPQLGAGGSPYTTTVTRSIIMCRISQTALAMASESDVNLGASGVAISGNSSIAGTLSGGGTVTSGNVATGSIDSANTVTQAGLPLDRGITGTATDSNGFTFRGHSDMIDISSGNALSKQASLQRVEFANRAIPTTFLYREGMYGSSAIPSSDQYLYKNAQPYYNTTGTNYRVWGIYSTSTGSFTTTGPPVGGLSTASAIPAWLNTTPPTIVYDSTSTPYLAVYLDLQQLLNVAAAAGNLNNPLVVFVAGSDGSVAPSTGSGSNFQHMVLVLESWPELISSSTNQSPPSLTIISPNATICSGNINTIQPIPFTIISPRVLFGLGGSATASFTGQIQSSSSTSSNVNSELALTSAGFAVSGAGPGGQSGGAANLVSSAGSLANESAGQSLYIALIGQQ